MGQEFERTDKALPYQDIRKYLHYFRNNLRFAIELEKSCTRNFSVSNIARHYGITQTGYYSIHGGNAPPCPVCRSTSCYNHIPASGVRGISDDSSVLNGTEFQVLGMNENFWSMYIRMQKLQIKFDSDHFKAHTSCGMHYHIMTAQDMQLPTVVLENFYQLLRKYMDVLLWITGGTKNRGVREGTVQWANPIHTFSPLVRPMRDIDTSHRYVAINLENQKYTPSGDMNGLWVELRFPDSNDVPASQTAFKCLFEALVYKAVEISEFGVLTTGTDSEWAKTKAVLNRICVNSLTDSDRDYLKSKGKELLNLVKNQLVSFDGESVQVLTRMLIKPIHVLLKDRKTPKQIDRYYLPRENRQSASMKALREIITLQQISETTAKKWRTVAGEKLGTSQGTVSVYLSRMADRGINTRFDRELGSYLITY